MIHALSITIQSYRLIFFREIGNVFGLCLHKKARKPNTYRSKYPSQSMLVTSNWNLSRSLALIWVRRSRTLSSMKSHWCVVKYSKHPTALASLSWIFIILLNDWLKQVHSLFIIYSNRILERWSLKSYIGFFPIDHANKSRK